MLRPGFVVYVPPLGRSGLLDAITGGATGHDRVDVPSSLLLEQLQLLPEERLDALLRKAAQTHPEIVLWEPRELKWNVGASSWLELVRGEEALWGVVPSWEAHQHVGWLLQSWRSE